MTLSMDRPETKRSPNRARPYTLTGGRTRARIELPIEATVETLVPNGEPDWAPGDVRTVIVHLCRNRPSIAEVSSYAGLPIGVTRVLVGDPGREYLPRERLDVVASYHVSTVDAAEDAEIAQTHVLQLSR